MTTHHPIKPNPEPAKILDTVRERARNFRGFRYHSSEHIYDDLAVSIKRFPGPVAGGRQFVLVHGIAVSSRYFRPVATELANIGEVFLIDLAGYGSAPKPRRDVSIADHARVLGDFLVRAGINNPVLVGHSMGSQVVSQLAFERPELSDRLVLMAPTIYPPERSLLIKARQLLFIDTFREKFKTNMIVFTDYLFRCGIPYFLAQQKQLFDDQMEDRLPFIHTKTLVVRGDRDPIVSRAWASAVAHLMPNATYTEVHGPHITMYSDPVGTAECIAKHAL